MLKLNVKLNNRVSVEAEGETQLEVFENASALQEVFGESCCGKCGSENITFRVRTVGEGKKTYKYPEMVCKSCWAKLSYGQSDGGVLFPVRYEREDKEYVRDANGFKIPRGDKGWVKYNKETDKEE